MDNGDLRVYYDEAGYLSDEQMAAIVETVEEGYWDNYEPTEDEVFAEFTLMDFCHG